MTGIEKLRMSICQRNFLRPITWVESYPSIWQHRLTVNR
jgi:hypothetical protein